MTTPYFNALQAIARPIHAADMPRSLEPMRHLLRELGNPQTRFQSIVVGGSVGKGTTSHQLSVVSYQPKAESLSNSSPRTSHLALSTGLYTGPHLHSFRERFRIDGAMITQAEFCAGMDIILVAENRTKWAYSTFERATALAFWWFAERGVQMAVLEVGIGGRWDAVNVVQNALAVITPIEMEHVAMLGGSLQTIAYHKAGIIQPNGQVISAVQHPIVAEVLEQEADLKNAKLIFTDDIPGAARQMLGLAGTPYQPDAPKLPGRLETISLNGRMIVIDGGHTVLAGRRLRSYIDQLAGDRLVCLVVGMLRDKSVRDYLRLFDSPRFRIILTTAPGHRALPTDALRQQAELQQANVEIVPDLSAALQQSLTAPEPLTVISGSLRMAAAAREAYGLLTPDELAEAQATRAIFEGDAYLYRLNFK
ncbi:MAG: hypothetical protein K8L97_00120 [Anaerolineae bacterium]|nr:hypothetical protein [Anaerolineae bacterium]